MLGRVKLSRAWITYNNDNECDIHDEEYRFMKEARVSFSTWSACLVVSQRSKFHIKEISISYPSEAGRHDAASEEAYISKATAACALTGKQINGNTEGR